MRFYDEYFMTEITNIFKAKVENDFKYEIDTLYGDFLDKEEFMHANSRTWNQFKRICKQLTELEAYSLIIRFMCGVFQKHEMYDMKKMHEILEEISVTEEIKLSDLCAEFFVYSQLIGGNLRAAREEKEAALKESIVKAKGLYFKNISELYCTNEKFPRILVEILPEYICARVYEYPIIMKEITLDDVENLVQIVLEKRKKHFDKEFKWIDETNAEHEEINNKIKDVHLSKLVKEDVTFYKMHCVVPGVILPIFKGAEVLGKNQLCYDILQQYVLKVFCETPWEQKMLPELQIMVSLLSSYADFIFSLVMKDGNWILTSPNYMYSSEQFMEEMIGKNDGFFVSLGKRLYKQYPEIATQFAALIERGKQYIRPIMPQYLYSNMVLHTTFMLYCTDQKEMALNHLLKNYEDIGTLDKRKLYFQVTLGRCILDCNNLEVANSLYGYFNYEMDRRNRERCNLFDAIDSMLQFLDDAKSYIRLKEEYTFDTRESWYDILYKNGQMDAFLEGIREQNEKQVMIEEKQFKQLFRIVEAYSYQTGIHLGLLGLPNYDGYDKLEGALSQELRLRGNGIVDKWDEYKAFFQSENLQTIYQNANVFFQHQLSKLVKNSIEESIQKIALLKTQYSDIDLETEEGQAFEQELDEICEDLAVKLQCYGNGRGEILNYIFELHDCFAEKYCPDCGELGLLQKLPEDIKNKVIDCLATSEIVYRMLSVRRDVNELDFSAALISLTKVVEMILNYVYSKMNVTYNNALDAKILSSYFWKGSRKEHIEFGPGIYLFKDAQIIKVDSEANNTLKTQNVYANKHFQLWGGDAVVDISKLRKYQDIDILVNKKVQGQNTVAVMHFKEDDTHNRMLLALGLDFIKDNYRNVGAHGEKIVLTKLEEVRELLILTENMVWILLDLLK